MFRPLTCGFLLAFALSPTSAAPQQVFRGRGEAVRVFTTVTDRDGHLVTTLTKDDFDVRDDGKTQPITEFDNTPQPIRIIVLLDTSGSMAGNLELVRAASQQLITRLRPDDQARIGTFGQDVAIGEEFTHDTRELLEAIPERIPPDAPTPLWRAVDEAMSKFDTKSDIRRVVLVLTDGKDSGFTDLRHRPSSEADVIDRAREDDVMIYGVGMRSRFAPGRQPMPGLGPGGLEAALTEDLPDPGLAKVADETGGGYTEIRYGEDLAAAFEHVADELHTQYLLGYTPPKHDGKVHKVEVRVNQKGLKARARKTYVAPKESRPSAGMLAKRGRLR